MSRDCKPLKCREREKMKDWMKKGIFWKKEKKKVKKPRKTQMEVKDIEAGKQKSFLLALFSWHVRLFGTPWTVAPGSSVHGISPAGALEWAAISYSRRIFPQPCQAAIRTPGFLPQFPRQFSRVCQAAAQGTGLLLGLASSCLWAGDSVTSSSPPHAGWEPAQREPWHQGLSYPAGPNQQLQQNPSTQGRPPRGDPFSIPVIMMFPDHASSGPWEWTGNVTIQPDPEPCPPLRTGEKSGSGEAGWAGGRGDLGSEEASSLTELFPPLILIPITVSFLCLFSFSLPWHL